MSAQEKSKLLLAHTKMNDVTPQANLALRGFSPKQRSRHIPIQSPPLSIMCLSSSPPPQKLDCVLVTPLPRHTKNFCHSSTRSPISPLPYLRALEISSMNYTNQLPVLTHHGASWSSPHCPHDPPRPPLMAPLIFPLRRYLLLQFNL